MAVAISAHTGDGGKIIVRGEREALASGSIVGMLRANGTDIQPGLMLTVEGETWPDVDLAADGETVFAAALEDPTGEHCDDIDDAWDDNSAIRAVLFPSPVELWSLGDDTAAAAYVAGQILTVSANTAGMVIDIVVDYAVDYCGRAAMSGTSATTPYPIRVRFM
jgi:hypothetical protein